MNKYSHLPDTCKKIRLELILPEKNKDYSIKFLSVFSYYIKTYVTKFVFQPLNLP